MRVRADSSHPDTSQLCKQDEDYVVDEATEGAEDDEGGEGSSSEEDNEQDEEETEDAPQDGDGRPRGTLAAATADSVSAAPSAVQHSFAGGSTVAVEDEIRRRLQGGCWAEGRMGLLGSGLGTASRPCSALQCLPALPDRSPEPVFAELGASLGGDDDLVFEEEILSDSDISQHFSEEEEEVDAAALLGDSSGPSRNPSMHGLLAVHVCCNVISSAVPLLGEH